MAPVINNHFGSVRVYQLTDPSVIYDNSARIATELFGMKELQEGGRTFSVHPASGYLFYADYAELWRNTEGSGLPSDKDEAERIARGFFEDANRRIAGSRPLAQERVPRLFPEDMRPMWIGAVVAKGTAIPDHWLCQFGAYLSADGDRTARVEGAAIGVRIGRSGKIVSLSSRWRPVTGDVLSAEPSDPAEKNPISAPSAGSIQRPIAAEITPISLPAGPIPSEQSTEADNPPEYLFWLADENAPQSFLAPVLLKRNDDDATIEAASAHSLHVEIWQRPAEDGIELLAVPVGGSGKNEYRWTYWTHDSLFVDGLQDLGTSQTAQLGAGVFNVLVQARDTITRAIAQGEQVVFTGK
jgi:hypothetical protein